MSFTNKVIAITGGASGIGLATAEYLAARGARVSICDRDQQALDKVAEKIKEAGGQALCTTLDIRKRADVEAWIAKTVETYGKLDGAVNAAGVGGRAMSIESVHEISDDDWDFVFDVNVKGVLNSIRAEVPSLSDGSSIVNLASLAGLVGGAKMAAYSSSKHAVVGLSRTAAKELGSRNIRVNVVCPGPIDTPLLASTSAPDLSMQKAFIASAPLGRVGKPEEVAALIAWLLSDSSSYVTGTSQVIDGGILAH